MTTDPRETDPSRCPLCGGDNQCSMVCSPQSEQPCWCVGYRFPPELLARVADRRSACLCEACVASYGEVSKSGS